MWSDPKRTTRLMCYYTLARDVRIQTERTVNVQCPYGARRHPYWGLRSENCFQISFTKIDPYGLRTEKKTQNDFREVFLPCFAMRYATDQTSAFASTNAAKFAA
jgi:hypothetical protein